MSGTPGIVVFAIAAYFGVLAIFVWLLDRWPPRR